MELSTVVVKNIIDFIIGELGIKTGGVGCGS